MTGGRERIAFGCDRLLAEPDRLAGRAWSLLAHGASITGASITGAGEPLHLALARTPAGLPAALFGPEHGYWGIEQDMVASRDQEDPWTGVPVVSLYGDDEESLRPRPEAFAGLELLLIDLQDIGSRYYTYAATAVWAAEAALAAGLEVWVLDRPNPLGGARVEGPARGEGLESFVGAFELPVRHGLTLGELVLLEASRRGWERRPEVWAIEGWRRSMLWEATGRPWLAPSPNMPTTAAAHLYPGLCLVEATELSEGRGTTRPFQLVGAPGLDGKVLAEALAALELPGCRAVPTFFRPQFQKHAGEVCGGVELLVTDPSALDGLRLGVELLAAVRRLAPECFAWRRAPYEFVSERPAVDLLAGGVELRRVIDEAGGAREALEEWRAAWPAYEATFRRERQAVLLYGEAE